jgi:hypothetical protein
MEVPSVAVKKVRLGDGVVGIDEEAKVAFVLKETSQKVLRALSKKGYKIIQLDSEFTMR